MAVDPSVDGERIAPLVTEKMKKEAAPKVKKEPKGKFLNFFLIFPKKYSRIIVTIKLVVRSTRIADPKTF